MWFPPLRISCNPGFFSIMELKYLLYPWYLRWTIVEPGWCLSSFFCNWMFSNFWVLSSKITFDCDIFLSFGIFGCHCIAFCFAWLLKYQSSSCTVSNSAEGGDVKSKSCLLFMINDQNFLMSIFVGLSCISKARRVYVFSKLSCIRIF